jgi:endonuclease III
MNTITQHMLHGSSHLEWGTSHPKYSWYKEFGSKRTLCWTHGDTTCDAKKVNCETCLNMMKQNPNWYSL